MGERNARHAAEIHEAERRKSYPFGDERVLSRPRHRLTVIYSRCRHDGDPVRGTLAYEILGRRSRSCGRCDKRV